MPCTTRDEFIRQLASCLAINSANRLNTAPIRAICWLPYQFPIEMGGAAPDEAGKQKAVDSGIFLYVDVFCRYSESPGACIRETLVGRVWVWCDARAAFPWDIRLPKNTEPADVVTFLHDPSWCSRLEQVVDAWAKRQEKAASLAEMITMKHQIPRQAMICLPDTVWQNQHHGDSINNVASCIVGFGITFLTRYRQNNSFFELHEQYDSRNYSSQKRAESILRILQQLKSHSPQPTR